MGKADIKMPEEFLLKISRLADKTDEIIPKVLEAGGEIVEAKVKSNLKAVIGKDLKGESRSTGELESSLGVTPVSIDRNGVYNVKVGFAEPRSGQNTPKRKRSYNERTNAMIANVLEYGKSGQPPRPFLKPAKAASKKACIEAMKETFEKEAGSL